MIKNGTTYHDQTTEEMAELLEKLRARRTRIDIEYGDTATGQGWGDIHERGTISRSIGPVKIPLLIKTRRSIGGTEILDHCIVMIRHSSSARGGEIYRHPNYKTGRS